MPSVAQTINLTTLNKYMKDYPSGVIVPELFLWHSGYDYLKANVKKTEFIGNNVKILMETETPFTFTAFGERVDLPYGSPMGFVEMFIPLKEVVATAEITKQMMERATGGEASWGEILPRILDRRAQDFLWGMEHCFIGDGTGRLARCNGTTDVSSSVTADRLRFCVDNTYTDFGWENTHQIKKGMWIEIYTAAGAQAADGATTPVTAWKVTNVWNGDRDNGVAVTPATTSGSEVACIEIACLDAQHATVAALCDDGATVFIYGTQSNTASTTDDVGASRRYEATNAAGSIEYYCSLPMGLTGIVQETDANHHYHSGTDYTLDVFQGLARSSYSTLNANFYDGSDLGGSQGTPEDWTLSIFTDAMNRVMDEGGHTDVLLMCSSMAVAMANQNATEGTFTVAVTSTGQFDQPAAGTRYAKSFYAPDGREIPVQIVKTIPDNCVYGLCLEDLQWYTKGNFQDMALTGEPWMLSPNQRKAVFENPFHGYSQLGAIRCDRHIIWQDLKNNV